MFALTNDEIDSIVVKALATIGQCTKIYLEGETSLTREEIDLSIARLKRRGKVTNNSRYGSAWRLTRST